MLIGIFTTLFSPEPNIKRNVSLLSLSDQMRFLITFIFALSIFILAYSNIDNPFTNKEPLGKFAYAFAGSDGVAPSVPPPVIKTSGVDV